MLAFAAVWIALASLLIAVAMLVYRPTFTDTSVVIVLYFGSPGALCLALLTLWAFRKEGDDDKGVRARRIQCRVAIAMAVAAAAIVYLLIIFSAKLETIEPGKTSIYNPPSFAHEKLV
jgi:peptidoglycan biosynthesis protein MviN/MurJ (putative lipid II flippase)